MITKTAAPQRILLTGGRAPVALELARQLHAGGHTIYVAESAAYHLCRTSNAVTASFRLPPPRQQPEAYLEKLSQLLVELEIQLLLPTCEEIFYIAHGYEQLNRICRVLSPPLESLRPLHHKGDFIRQVRQAGLAAPVTRLITDAVAWQQAQQSIRKWVQSVESLPEDLVDPTWLQQPVATNADMPISSLQASKPSRFADKSLSTVQTPSAGRAGCQAEDKDGSECSDGIYDGPVVLKPAYSRFASRVLMPAFFRQLYRDRGRRTDRQSTLSAAVPASLSAAEPWIAQRYLEGGNICTYSIVHEGVVVAHAAYRSQYRSSQAGASVHFEALDGADTLAWVRQFIEGQQRTQGNEFSGQISFDLISSAVDQQLYPIECNPRTTSGVHLFRPEDGLELALLCPDQLVAAQRIIQPQPGSRAMLTLPMLISGWRQRWSGQDWKRWFAAMRGTRDAIYHARDRGPYIEQFRLVRAAWRLSRQQRISVTEALTHDIEWNGQPIQP
ncbi:hypothetical protein [Paenibacillus bovis]|uniref:ATP-grasp domain-containing protein n=1 Tax=Paenibacillus bovis TaxID=1616788 RepID=A0A172ZE08_9BACL|nr:hypothetical protein [Paenibacillus bovis]ANF95507.1 hypothetical protein AR543_05450 [Paenibacillus bovis]